MSTSLSYNFSTEYTVDKLIDNAFWMLGIPPEKITPRDILIARDIGNLELSIWASQNQILSLIERRMMDLIPTQSFFALPDEVVNVYECTIANYTRMIGQDPTIPGGVAIASEGDATPCFSPSSSTGLTQTTPNGWIGYNFTSGPAAVWYVGVSPLSAQNYTLAIEYSFDNIKWLTGVNIPTATYIPLTTTWFIYESPPNAPYWRIRELRGNTLSINQIYFAQPNLQLNSQALGSISSDQYMQLSQQFYNTSAPSGFYFNNSKTRSIYLYGNDYTNFTSLIYSAQVFCQDLGKLFNNIGLARKLYYPLTVSIALGLSLSFNDKKYNVIKSMYDRIVPATLRTDREQVDITYEYNMTHFWSF